MKKIMLTGGGTAGHVTPHIALLPALKEAGFEIEYIGSVNGIERGLIEEQGIPYYGITAGKLRRYVDVRNFTDLFRVVKGLGDAFALIRRVKPDVVFSKGGFVTVPVVVAARMSGVPVAIHESDISPGLANRLSIPFSDKVCVNFPETLQKIPKRKGEWTGTPIRGGLFTGDRFKGAALCGFEMSDKPVVLFTGGSLGSGAINACLRESLPRLLKRYKIIHLCGKGNRIEWRGDGYVQFEYVTDELPHLFALADMVVSRAGANTIFELLALQKPHILIPLTREASRGDQLLNAASFEKQGFSLVLQEPKMTEITLSETMDELYINRKQYRRSMASYAQKQDNGCVDGTAKVMKVIRSLVKNSSAH